MAGFHRAPEDWFIVIADIKKSTQSVSAGLYKQVNMVGASCITAVLNALDKVDIPFIFGGDGATLLVPGHLKLQARTALVNVRELALDAFNIQLRIGFVGVWEANSAGHEVLVAKHQLSRGNSLAMFSGGGIEYADRLIKADIACRQYAVAESPASGSPDLTGLSCRWQPLESNKGQMICLIIRALDGDTQNRHRTLSAVLSRISEILDNDIASSSPVSRRTLKFSWPPVGLKIEAVLTRGEQPYWRRYVNLLFESLLQSILERFQSCAGDYDARVYGEEVQANADYRRFDDSLRLILDCSPSQISQMTQLLEQQHRLRNIAYGIHKTGHAQMTCLVFSLKHHEHIHFIDGSEGGFWAASQAYKHQLKTL